MQKIFQYDNVTSRVELNVPEILLVREFAALMNNERNKSKTDPKGEYKERAFREFTYIQLALAWDSVYADYPEQERHQEALKDSLITEEEFNNHEFRAACRKYKEIQEQTRSIKMLKAAQNTVDNFIDYFNTVVDLNERDINGKPIFKTKDVIQEISNLHKVHEELQILEANVKKEIAETSSIRGGAVVGFEPNF